MKKFLVLLLICFLFSCSNEEISLTDSFFKVYDDSNFDLSYHPVDVVETIDGYIILSGTELDAQDFRGVQLIKVDEEGKFVSEISLDNYVIPVGELFLIDSICYFFAANPTSLDAVLIGVNPKLTVTLEVPINEINYPLASNITSVGNLLLLSYDPVNLTSEISEIGTDGAFMDGKSYSIGPGSDVESEIINHLLNTNNRQLPFFCGENSTRNYFFNGYYNYSLSMVFTTFADAPSGVLQGQRANAGISAALSLGGGNFALAGYQFTDNFQLSSTAISTTGITSSADLYTGNMAELKAYTPSKILTYTSGGTSYTVFAAETEGRQIVLYFYDADSGEISGIHHIGYLNPFTLSSMKVTSDNALLVMGTTFVSGRFERISLTKYSEKEVSSFLK